MTTHLLTLSAVLLVVGASLVHSTSYSPLDLTNADYQDEMMQSLYKRLSQLDDGYFKAAAAARDYDDDDDDQMDEDNTGYGVAGGDYSSLQGDGQRVEKPRTPTEIRDSEYLAHSAGTANGNYIYVSGGAGEGKQHLAPDGLYNNIAQVKSDESLPFYCHPPNPCPKGYTSENGCQDFIVDTAEEQKAWISKMQDKGLCSCDEEHMFSCPKDQSVVNKVSDDDVDNGDNDRLDDVINNILQEKSANPFAGGQKRQSLVAKKSPRVKRSGGSDRMESELEKLVQTKRNSNPYLAGEKLRTVAKKGLSKGKLLEK